ncbi:MAG TPA: hydrogenase expression/formation protein HypE [Deltaproteobacteria bacterium]|nr:hydrogenase expression/formation protein HypE [Deltaproteobacteria bacterium]HPR56148.1 hydrogenase expression/formation protein HypE [Deltaproteobacteria bacterium]HXK47729.1 hydrogenase expression/formation protein HypE [Deltaproteobacteria bacterium]
MKNDAILLEHGSGGMLMNELIRSTFMPVFRNEYLDQMGDSAVIRIGNKRACFTTDSYVVDPIFFPGGDIGSLAVHGTVNDIAMCGGRPLFMSAGIILEEGFPREHLDRIVASMGDAARAAGVQVVTGDTKVVPRGSADKIFINTSGIGIVEYRPTISAKSIRKGDAVIVSGTIGDHGAAILCTREDLGFRSTILSDSAALNGLVAAVLKECRSIRFMRDATRGGLGAVLVEAASASGLAFEIEDQRIPVRDDVRGLCEILGLDPLFIANEGKMVVICSARDAGKVLEVMKAHPLGADAAVIGHVTGGTRGRVVLQTFIGGSRELDLPEGELIPRIC